MEDSDNESIAESGASSEAITARNAHVNQLVKYIINAAGSKYPIKITELLSVVQKSRSLLMECMVPVRDQLKTIFGLNFYEVSGEDSSSHSFIVTRREKICSPNELDDKQILDRTVLFFVLSNIFMNEDSALEDAIITFLKNCKIMPSDSVSSSRFGTQLHIRKLITETFVRQLYLKRKNIATEMDLGPKFIYRWGFRAEKEYTREDVLALVAKIFGKQPENFKTAYRRVQDSKLDPRKRPRASGPSSNEEEEDDGPSCSQNVKPKAKHKR